MIDFLSIKDILDLNEESVYLRIKELEDCQLEQLFNDISYSLIESYEKDYKKLDKILIMLEEEIESRNLSIEEMELMKELYF